MPKTKTIRAIKPAPKKATKKASATSWMHVDYPVGFGKRVSEAREQGRLDGYESGFHEGLISGAYIALIAAAAFTIICTMV